MATSALARAELVEPDVTLFARIVDALSEETPGEAGWHAYWLMGSDGWNPATQLESLNAVELERARVLTSEFGHLMWPRFGRLSAGEFQRTSQQWAYECVDCSCARARAGDRHPRVLRGRLLSSS